MTFLQWRRFNFFEKEVVKYPESTEIFSKLKDIDITACASGRGQMTLGDSEGNLLFLDRNLELDGFKAFELRVTHIFQLKQHNIIFTIGQDEPGINPVIKVWNLDKRDKSNNPSCTRITRALPGSNVASNVTAIAVSENLNMMAIGFQDGSVTLFKGDVTRDRHSKSPKIVYKGRVQVTGLAFRHSQRSNVLFISTEETVVSCHIGSKDVRVDTLDNHGCPLRCAVMSDATQDNQFVIGRSDAVYFYQTDGRGPCLAFEGRKAILHWFRGYLVVVTKDSKTMPRQIAGEGVARMMDIVTVYDIQNKFIAYSAPVPEVMDVIQEWGSLYVLGGDRKLYQLQEKDTQTKLEMLFKKNLYVMAINLAKSQHYDYDGLIDIFTQYGDHLYSKGDHDGAIAQYKKTIGRLEPSYVIRKFLDAQRIHNLTAYLQELHKQAIANEDHTTLLLNCYTKLKDTNKLDEFIMTKDDKSVDFDVETAIKVCRQAGYFRHALFLAEKHRQHDWYLKVQLEDIKDYQKALSYIATLDFHEAMDNMKKCGKTLMTEVPKEATDFLKVLCTDYKPADRPLVDPSTLGGGMPPPIQRASVEEFIHIFVNNSSQLMEFLEHMIKVQTESSSQIYNTLLELYLHDMAHEAERRPRLILEKKAMGLLQTGEARYDIDQALVLCQMHSFQKGILYLYEKAQLYQQILHYHMEHNSYDQIIDACKRYGNQDPNLWVQALSYFAAKEENCKPFIVEVLSQIDRRNLLPPLLVIQTLAHNSTATLSVIKDYIVRRLQQENDQIAEDERLIKQYREETRKMKSQIEEMKTSAKMFQVSKCSVCNHPLELPSIHFLCQHSYHQHCFESYAENEQECPACLPENRKVLDIIKAQEQSKDLHEQFHRQLEKSQDGFSVVADYFGRGVFNKVTLVTDSFGSPSRQPATVSRPQPSQGPTQAPRYTPAASRPSPTLPSGVTRPQGGAPIGSIDPPAKTQLSRVPASSTPPTRQQTPPPRPSTPPTRNTTAPARTAAPPARQPTPVSQPSRPMPTPSHPPAARQSAGSQPRPTPSPAAAYNPFDDDLKPPSSQTAGRSPQDYRPSAAPVRRPQGGWPGQGKVSPPNPFSSPASSQASRASPSRTGGSAPKKPPALSNPFDDNGDNPFDDDVDEEDRRNNPFYD
ncbi:vacuolar protein sorting-associated protein 11 homolog [Diadema antillarum]|uniref:vacuolar protein sorting-associated protein 11 homolog n=1 Tax=Diadema antillarum TaxID=105358 RepID=UPI003A8C0F7F